MDGGGRDSLTEFAHRLPADEVALDGMDERWGRPEACAGNDQYRIRHAVRELERQRASLPAEDDWRTQMQALVAKIDTLRRVLERLAAERRGNYSGRMERGLTRCG